MKAKAKVHALRPTREQVARDLEDLAQRLRSGEVTDVLWAAVDSGGDETLYERGRLIEADVFGLLGVAQVEIMAISAAIANGDF